MFAIFEHCGFQYKAIEGKTVNVPKIALNVGVELTIPHVLCVVDEETTVGSPYVKGFLIKAEIIKHNNGKKIKVFKKARRKGYRKTQGHRQPFTQIKILEIQQNFMEDHGT